MKTRITKTRVMMMVMLVALLFGGVIVPTGVAQAKKAPPTPTTQDITGTFTDAVGGAGTFAGKFTVTKFATKDGSLVAQGNLVGTLTDSLGNVTSVKKSIGLPVSLITATCSVLHLELGPLNLTLLGLVVHLDKVVLDISADPTGGLLGSLLCSLAGALNNSPLNAIVSLLNQILQILG